MSDLKVGTRDREGDVTILDLDGVLNKGTSAEVERALQALADRGRLRVVINCEHLTAISSDGMGVFLSQLIKIRKSGGDIKFCSMREETRTVLAYLGLTKLLTVRENERDALSEFRKTAAPASASREPEKLRVEIEDQGPVAVLALNGFVDRHTIELLDRALRGQIETGRARVVVDCAQLSYISSNGMGVFISYVNKARTAGGDIRFCAMRDVAKTVITMLGLHQLFRIFETRQEAVASFKS